jgi:NAD+--asparagine ADP-ribosyltransferase
MTHHERYATDKEYREKWKEYSKERYRGSERAKKKAREYIKRPNVAARRKVYMEQWKAAKRGDGIMPDPKFYNKEKLHWTTPSQEPVRFYHPKSVGPNAGKVLIKEREFEEYHSPELETIHFVGL